MLVRYPRYSALLNSYAYFLELILHNAEEAAKYHRRADEQKLREVEEAKSNDGSGSIDTQCVIAITEDGQIEQVNKTLLKVFGYNRKEVMGRNIRMLVPSPWKEKHDAFLQRYRQTGVSKVIARPQTLYGQHKSGVSFQMKLTIQERRKENGERQYIGMISPITTENLNGVIIITEMGYIRLVTQRTLDLFGGYEASDLLTRNVNMLMIDSIAVAHDNHLKRYRDTGEARVIGTSGRNVPGRRKDNSVFPAALTVEELFLEGERSFMANIQDTSNTVGTIFMDGFGMIQNSDLGLQQLLGYRKEDIVGKNIKSIMPPPYSEYHDMYLERYRRTKVSNILRSTEGRILPAIHADGSAVSIRAIIARADTGDGTSGMLFKGIIKRGDLTSMSGKDFRKGYFENYEISLNKAGVIVRIKRQILTMLGHAADRPLSDFIGQPIEVLIPAMPDRPSQAKTNWMLRALKDPELNFYLLAVCKNFTLLPISFCLQASNEGDTIRMRIRDLSDADALMNIDEVGNVLSYNDDAYILLGHEPDDVIGRNIKLIQPPEVAANHDGYLKKYKNLKDKQAGVPRSVNGMHRDGNPIPIEIQITDMKGSEGQKGIIGRLRHRSLEDRVPRDLVLKYFTNTKHLGDLGADGASASVIASATSVTSGASRLRFKGKTASSNRSGIVGNSEKSQQSISKLSGGKSAAFADDTINYQMASHSDIGSESSGTGSRTSATTRNRIFDEKFKSIHNSEKDDPSLSRLGFILNIILGLYVVIFAIGLLLINLIPSPEPYYELLDLVTQYNVKLNEVIFASRFLALAKNESVNIGPCAFTNKTTLSVPVCEWVAAGIKYPHKTVPELEELWHESAEGFVDVVTLFEERYHKIRRPGDVLDKYIQGTFKMYQFVNGTPSTYTSFSLYTLWNVAGVFSDAANTLDANLDLSDKSTRAWNLVLANRLFMNDIIYDLVHLVPEVVKSSVENTVIYHLILAIISVVCGALGLFFAIIPQFRAVQQDREKILRLIVQLPKSVVYDLVYKVYATVDLEAEESQEEAAEIDFQLEQAKKEAADEDGDDEDGVEGGAGIDVQDISVIPDRSNKLYAAFAIGLFSISLPLIVHVAWRYAYDVELYKTVTLVTDFSILYTESISLSWRPMGFYLNCVDEKFCDKYPKNRDAFLKNVDHLREYYEEALSLSASIPSINAIFQNSITEPYKSPQNLLDRMAKSGDPFLPKGYADKTTLGMSTMINNILDSAGRLAARFDAQTMDDFWFLWEVLNNEGETGMYTLFEAGLEKFTMDLSSGTLAANATYAVGLVYAIAVFWFGFGAIRNYIRSETKASRNALYMVPIQVVRVTKPIIEYVEELHLSLTKG